MTKHPIPRLPHDVIRTPLLLFAWMEMKYSRVPSWLWKPTVSSSHSMSMIQRLGYPDWFPRICLILCWFLYHQYIWTGLIYNSNKQSILCIPSQLWNLLGHNPDKSLTQQAYWSAYCQTGFHMLSSTRDLPWTTPTHFQPGSTHLCPAYRHVVIPHVPE